MKLKSLPVLFLLSALAVQAEVIMVSGTVYDAGKGNHSQDPDLKGYTADSNHCWAATSANLIQHWLDAYGDRLDLDGVPNGEVTDVTYTMPSGTRYLNVYNDISDNFQDDGGTLGMAVDWYFNGTEVSGLKAGHAAGGYLKDEGMSYFGGSTTGRYFTLASLKNQLGNAINRAAGYGAFLTISKLDGSGSHAITCWGLETDADGNLCALYVTDSDDMKFGAQRLEVRREGTVIKLDSQNTNSSYYGGQYKLNSFTYLESSKFDQGDFVYEAAKPSNALTALPENGEISTAADMTGQSFSANHGLTLKQGALLAASGGQGTSLTLAGGGAAGDGLSVQPGAMGVLKNAAVSVSGFAGNGIACGADLYLDGGTVAITGNGGIGIAAQGTVDDPKVYVGVSGNSSVNISDNAKGGLLVKGGALPIKDVEDSYYRAGATADINNNSSVEVSRNSAVDGAGAFVTGTLNVKSNTGSVVFDHNTATGKGGALAVNVETFNSVVCAGRVDISGNTAVTFSNNTATQGGAIYATNLTLDDNVYLAFSGNTAAQGAALYGTSKAHPAAQEGYYTPIDASISVKDNQEIRITGNTATDTGVIFFQGYKMSLSGNTAVDISGNTVESANGAVVNNGNEYTPFGSGYAYVGGRVMEISHNGSVTFAENTAKFDIYNEGTLYLCADADQTITFQHGFQNSAKTTGGLAKDGGTTYIGKDAAGTASTGGAYRFEDGSAAVEMKTSAATVEAGGGMVFSPGVGLAVGNAEFAEAEFTLESASLSLSDVVFNGDLTVALGYFEQENKLTLTNVTFGSGASLALSLDLAQAMPMLLLSGADGSASLTETTVIDVSKYLAVSGSTSLDGVALTLTVDGRLADGSDLVINTAGLMPDKAVTVTGYEYDRTEGSKLYYSSKSSGSSSNVPEPATATLSLLALAALCARRRRK